MTSNKKEYKTEWAKNNRKTFKGYCRQAYNRQKDACKTRGMEQPKYTLKEFEYWLRGQDFFWELFRGWKNIGDRNIQPSVDRLDNKKTYSFDNIQVTTLYDNLYISGQKARMAGVNKWQKTLAGRLHLKRLGEIGRRNLHIERTIVCAECNKSYITKSAKAMCCSRLCEQRHRRKRIKSELNRVT